MVCVVFVQRGAKGMERMFDCLRVANRRHGSATPERNQKLVEILACLQQFRRMGGGEAACILFLRIADRIRY